jgi:hypothetical protein
MARSGLRVYYGDRFHRFHSFTISPSGIVYAGCGVLERLSTSEYEQKNNAVQMNRSIN